MSISLNFELNDLDLEHFKAAMTAAAQAAEGKPDDELVECAAQLLRDAQGRELPDFIMQRLLRVDDMIAMVRDQAWALEGEDRQRVLSALAYFCNPDDVIPDHAPVLGYLDDAIMIEMSVLELQHELDAYDEFCEYRAGQAEIRGLEADKVGRTEWLASRREELVERMHRRRERTMGAGYGSSSGYASGRSSYTRAWRPGLFRYT
jgi:uncharacterized membrane protein YkvA (DUF1232 family)